MAAKADHERHDRARVDENVAKRPTNDSMKRDHKGPIIRPRKTRVVSWPPPTRAGCGGIHNSRGIVGPMTGRRWGLLEWNPPQTLRRGDLTPALRAGTAISAIWRAPGRVVDWTLGPAILGMAYPGCLNPMACKESRTWRIMTSRYARPSGSAEPYSSNTRPDGLKGWPLGSRCPPDDPGAGRHGVGRCSFLPCLNLDEEGL